MKPYKKPVDNIKPPLCLFDVNKRKMDEFLRKKEKPLESNVQYEENYIITADEITALCCVNRKFWKYIYIYIYFLR